MSTGLKILIVDDDEALRTMLETYLSKEGFEVVAVPDGHAMNEALKANDIDLIVLDVVLPDGSGFNLVRNLRRSSSTPVILLTGKSDSIDRIVGLELGADDYVCKPFELRELLARIRSVLRRHDSATKEPADPITDQVATFDGWTFDEARRQLLSPTGEEVRLTSAEFELLRLLVEAAPNPVSREELLKATQSRNWDPNDRSVDISVSRLRKKLEKNPKHPTLIKSVRNVGYVLTDTVVMVQRQGML